MTTLLPNVQQRIELALHAYDYLSEAFDAWDKQRHDSELLQTVEVRSRTVEQGTGMMMPQLLDRYRLSWNRRELNRLVMTWMRQSTAE